MLHKDDLLKAVKMFHNPSEYLNCEWVHKQLVLSLELYEDRGEFDGSPESALECLELAGYEFFE